MLKRFLSIILIGLIAFLPATASAIKYKGDLESNESITFPEQASKPTSPASTKYKLYFKDDGVPYHLDSSGNENPVLRSGLRNAIINGNFDLWQRGTSFTPSNLASYTADRWQWWNNGSPIGTMDITRQAFTVGQTDVPGEPEYFIRATMTTLGTGQTAFDLWHNVEDVRTFAGQTVTLSFWVARSAGTNLQAFMIQEFGSGGSSAVTTTFTGLPTLVPGWTKVSATVAIPSISGKAIGTGSALKIIIRFGSTTTADVYDLAQVQLEKGSVATEFENRPFGLELALAQRYYQKTFPYATAPAQSAGIADALCYNALLAGVNKFNLNWYLKTPMRTDPTITYYNPSAANNKFRNTPDAGDSGTPATDVLSPNYIFIRNPQVATDAVGEQVCIHAAADAEL